MAASSCLLLSRPDRVGDVVISTACLEPIRRQRPGARIVFLAREAMRPLLEGHPLLDGFIALPGEGEGNFAARRHALVSAMQVWRPDALVHLHPDPLCQQSGQMAGIALRVGYRGGNLWRDWRTLTEARPDRRPLGRRHEAECLFDLLTPLGIAAPEGGAGALRPSVHLPARWEESLRAKLGEAADDPGGYSVLNPAAFSPTLRWPPAAFAELARAAAGRLGRIVLAAERADDPSAVEIRRLLGPDFPGLADVSGRCNLAELGWLLRGARVLVSRNTGTTHLAAAVGCPVVELFGRREPVYGPDRWRALGERTAVVVGEPGSRRWTESKRAYWRRGHEVISPEAVLREALQLAKTS